MTVFYISLDADNTIVGSAATANLPVGAIEVTAAQYATVVVGTSYWLNNTVLQNNPNTPNATAALWVGVRTQRDTLIRETDWTQMADVKLTVVQKANWRVYRQELRDITKQPDPTSIIWPAAPLNDMVAPTGLLTYVSAKGSAFFMPVDPILFISSTRSAFNVPKTFVTSSLSNVTLATS